VILLEDKGELPEALRQWLPLLGVVKVKGQGPSPEPRAPAATQAMGRRCVAAVLFR